MSEPQSYWVYILASQKNDTLYIGVTGRLLERIYKHREGLVPGFTKEYRVTKLVHVEEFAEVRDAIVREKAMKNWNRAWKVELIEKDNPERRDLWFDLNR